MAGFYEDFNMVNKQALLAFVNLKFGYLGNKGLKILRQQIIEEYNKREYQRKNNIFSMYDERNKPQ